MGKIQDMVADAALSAENSTLEAKAIALQGPSMADYISGSPSPRSGQLDDIRTSIKAGQQASFARIASRVGGSGMGQKIASSIEGGAGSPAVHRPMHPGNGAGLVNESSTLISMEGTGMDAPNMRKASTVLSAPAPSRALNIARPGISNVMDYRTGKSAAAQLLARRLL